MNASHRIGLGIALIAALGTGYFAGRQGPSSHEAKVGATEGNPRGSSGTAPAAASTSAGSERKVLYYRNPMGQPDTSPVPKKDSMGMDYIPVYADEAGGDEPGTVVVSPARVQKLGVRTASVERRALDTAIRAVGAVAVDERRLVTVAPRFEGWIERLHVASTGQPVKKGQALFEVYSPELASAQREYQMASEGLTKLADAPEDARAGLRQLQTAAKARLVNWDLSAAQIAELGKPGERRTLRFDAPASGVVLEKKAVQGMRFMPGEMLYQIADLSRVWVIADVFERDAAALKVGQGAVVRLNGLPGREFTGRLDYVYPSLNAATRTVPVRVELANADGALRPAMYAEVELKVGAGTTAIVIPASAVLDSGPTQRVLLVKGEGRFVPREVKLGRRDTDFVEVLEGLKEGEQVVVAANFLIDSESQLKAAFNSLTAGETAKSTTPPAVSHHATGTLDAINPDGSVSISHGPVATLKWPSMTMEFVPASADLLRGIKPGAQIEFDFAEGKPGEWVVSKLSVSVSKGKEPAHAH